MSKSYTKQKEEEEEEKDEKSALNFSSVCRSFFATLVTTHNYISEICVINFVFHVV